jgi:nitrogen regulatory protein P-II 1
MKRIEAIIQPFKLEAVKAQLLNSGATGMTIAEVWGSGQQGGIEEHYRGAVYTVAFLPKIKVEMIVDDDQVEGILDALMSAAKTGNIGDGKIVLTTLADVVRIRTGEHGAEAL